MQLHLECITICDGSLDQLANGELRVFIYDRMRIEMPSWFQVISFCITSVEAAARYIHDCC